MITGNDTQEIVGYLPIDHMCEGLGWVWLNPTIDARFLGFPWGYVEEHA